MGDSKGSVCSWIRLQTLRSGSLSELPSVSSDKGREVGRAPVPLP